MINRVRKCKVCDTDFNTSQFNAKYCPDHRNTARNKSQTDRRQTVAEKRALRISQSDEWLRIARECRRAGTVEILQGVDIPLLLAVYKAKSKTGSYNSETKKSQYDVCHISPVSGKDTVGLLNHMNLFIGNSFPNKKFGNKSYEGKGLCIPKNKLKAKWRVTDKTSNGAILKKVTDYLGPALIEYAKDHPINTSLRFGLAKWLIKNDPNNTLPLSTLESMSTTELRAARAKIEQKQVQSITYSAKRSFVVMLDECKRLSEQLPVGQHQSDIKFMVPVLQVAIAWLARQPDQQGFSSVLTNPYMVTWNPLQLRDGMKASTLRDFISFTAFEALQGAPVDRKMIRTTLSRYLEVTSLTPDYSRSSSSMQEHFADDYSLFFKQVPVIKDAIIRLGLPDKLMLAEEIEAAKQAAYEETMFASFQMEQCEGPDDYSTIHYEIDDEDDYDVEDGYAKPVPLIPYEWPSHFPF